MIAFKLKPKLHEYNAINNYTHIYVTITAAN